MEKKIQTAKLKTPFIFLVLLLIVGCTPTKQPVEFEFEKTVYDHNYFQRLNYSGINITRGEKTYHYSFGDFKDFRNGAEVIMVNDLDDDHEIDIWVRLTACGANCSQVDQILFYDPDSDNYASTEPLSRGKIELINYQNGDSSKKIFVTQDESFIYIFSKPVTGIGPIQIFEYKDKRFQDITIEYPQIVEEDAKYWEARLKNVDVDLDEEYSKLTGIQRHTTKEILDENNEMALQTLYLVSYIADMCLIEKCEKGWELLYSNCAEENMESCKRYEESIKLALETRKVYE